MGLTVAAFTPDSITIGTDSHAEVKNTNEGYFITDSEKLFVMNDRFLVAIEGNTFQDGLPISYYMHQESIRQWNGNQTKDLARFLVDQLSAMFPIENMVIYTAGYDSEDTGILPKVYMINNGRIELINIAQDGKCVYNYHAIGRTHWINKLIMQTRADIGSDSIEFPSCEIDFSKYSSRMGKEFVCSMLELSEKMDRLSQVRPSIGEKYQIAAIRPFSKIEIEIC